MRYDRAWHVVTSRIALPASATAEDSFGAAPPANSQHPPGPGPRAGLRRRVLQRPPARRQRPDRRRRRPPTPKTSSSGTLYAAGQEPLYQHVLPLLSACTDAPAGRGRPAGCCGRGSYEKHMIIVMSSVRTLEAALRHCPARPAAARPQHPARARSKRGPLSGPAAAARRRSLPARRPRPREQLGVPQLMSSLRVRSRPLVANTLGVPAEAIEKRRRRRRNALGQWHLRRRPDRTCRASGCSSCSSPSMASGLAGERFQILFAEVMDAAMAAPVGATSAARRRPRARSTACREHLDTGLHGTNPASTSRCIGSLCDWAENHCARLAIEVLSRISDDPARLPVSLLRRQERYQALALGRLAALRISELI